MTLWQLQPPSPLYPCIVSGQWLSDLWLLMLWEHWSLYLWVCEWCTFLLSSPYRELSVLVMSMLQDIIVIPKCVRNTLKITDWSQGCRGWLVSKVEKLLGCDIGDRNFKWFSSMDRGNIGEENLVSTNNWICMSGWKNDGTQAKQAQRGFWTPQWAAGSTVPGLCLAQGVQYLAGWLAFTYCCLPYLRLIEL